MNKIILAVTTAIVATNTFVIDASANQNNAASRSRSTNAEAHGHASSYEELFGLAAVNFSPIQGSITYGGQPKTRLLKAPVGSTFTNDFFSGGNSYTETYLIQPDRSLKLIDRIRRDQN